MQRKETKTWEKSQVRRLSRKQKSILVTVSFLDLFILFVHTIKRHTALCLHIYISVHHMRGACGGWKRELDLLQQESRTVVNHYGGAEKQPRFSARTTSAPNLWATAPTPTNVLCHKTFDIICHVKYLDISVEETDKLTCYWKREYHK